MPWDFYEPDPNRLVWAADAEQLWKKIRSRQAAVSKRLSSEVITAAQRPGSGATAGPDDARPGPTTTPAEEPSRSAEEIAAENGLCA